VDWRAFAHHMASMARGLLALESVDTTPGGPLLRRGPLNLYSHRQGLSRRTAKPLAGCWPRTPPSPSPAPAANPGFSRPSHANKAADTRAPQHMAEPGDLSRAGPQGSSTDPACPAGPPNDRPLTYGNALVGRQVTDHPRGGVA
jgi:hypothetical protein